MFTGNKPIELRTKNKGKGHFSETMGPKAKNLQKNLSTSMWSWRPKFSPKNMAMRLEVLKSSQYTARS